MVENTLPNGVFVTLPWGSEKTICVLGGCGGISSLWLDVEQN